MLDGYLQKIALPADERGVALLPEEFWVLPKEFLFY
jgi:hypothetical protein